MKSLFFPCFLAGSLALGACSSSDEAGPKTDADYERDVTAGMHETLLGNLKTLHGAAVELAAAAPQHAWDPDADAGALDAMTAAWLRARAAYEQSEGALAPLFPDLDAAIDARYEDLLEPLGDEGDRDLFDDEGVTGMHAVERILFAPTTPKSVIELEATLPGYAKAAWPTTDDEALEFKTKLCARLVTDTETLLEQWSAATHFDLPAAFRGLVDLTNEQREKVRKAASEEEESRYAQRTMADLRDNLAGTTAIYGLFRPWLVTKDGGGAIDGDIQSAFASLAEAYAGVDGDAIPAPPASFSAEAPSADDLATPFGMLYSAVQDAVDPNRPGSAVDGMDRAAVALGFPELAGE